jgi:hypothetical protein
MEPTTLVDTAGRRRSPARCLQHPTVPVMTVSVGPTETAPLYRRDLVAAPIRLVLIVVSGWISLRPPNLLVAECGLDRSVRRRLVRGCSDRELASGLAYVFDRPVVHGGSKHP